MATDANLGTFRPLCPHIPAAVRQIAFLRNSCGAAAVEFVIVFPLLVALFLPITDIAMVVFQTVSAHQAMRSLGAYATYHPPDDVTSISSWQATLPTIPGYSITTTVFCGTDAANPCAFATAQPKWFQFSTNIIVTPILGWNICATPCTLTHTERFY